MDLAADAHERHLEAALIDRIRQFRMELGNGFAFIGQHRLEVGDRPGRIYRPVPTAGDGAGKTVRENGNVVVPTRNAS